MNRVLKAFIFFLIISSNIACENFNNKNSDNKYLKLIYSYKLNFPEPSGLAFSVDKKSLWTVSDHNSKIYQISLDGKIIRFFKISAKDLEGITEISDSNLAVVSERSNSIILISTKGNKLRQKSFKIGANSKSGLEGVTFNENKYHFYLLKEKHKGLLIEIDSTLNEISRVKLNIANDYSGIYYDSDKNHLWILSDEDRSIFECDLIGKVLNQYKIDVPNPEGIAIDLKNQKIYIVSDSAEKLYVFKFIANKKSSHSVE